MNVQQIPINNLKIGMYVISLDIAWPVVNPYKYKHLIECQQHIEFFKEIGVENVMVDLTLSQDGVASETISLKRFPVSLDNSLSAARNVRYEAMTTLQGVYEGVRTGCPIDNEPLKKTVMLLLRALLQHFDVMLSLIHFQRNNINMFAHAINVCALALAVGKTQGYSDHQLELLGIGALLHDIGELRLPRNLLWKRGVYDAQERRLVQQHPMLGIKILSESNGLEGDSVRIVSEHHERINGSGYPAGLRGAELSPLSQIVGIVDLYDAMLSSREGRPPLLAAQAMNELHRISQCGVIDHYWTQQLIRCLGIYPEGSVVELNTGEIAIVIASNERNALRPKVRIIYDERQRAMRAPIGEIDLDDVQDQKIERDIIRVLEPDLIEVDTMDNDVHVSKNTLPV